MAKEKITLFWFRRDLRLADNAGLYHALKAGLPVVCVFLFDQDILQELDPMDSRISFIRQSLVDLGRELRQFNTSLVVGHGAAIDFFKDLFKKNNVGSVYLNHDYEPYARVRDARIERVCHENAIEFKSFKDHVIFEKNEVLTDLKKPYTVFTPYKKKWLSQLNDYAIRAYPTEKYANHFKAGPLRKIPSLVQLGFPGQGPIAAFPEKTTGHNLSKLLKSYEASRDFPHLDATTRLGVHLRFGTVSIRRLVGIAYRKSDVWLSELIWREFFSQILWHYPHVTQESFRAKFDNIKWRVDERELTLWKTGQTGYALVDAGMRELNQTGFMHNRVRMIAASFLTKHLLHHWSEGERYFAEKLLDYELASNNGNWQWAAGTGCDASPYFRVFNPLTQQKRFDPELRYVKKWIREYGTDRYPKPMVAHAESRLRAIATYKEGLK